MSLTSNQTLRFRRADQTSMSDPLAILSWQGKRADQVWTRAEWSALCEHLHNGNGQTHFVMGFQKDGEKQYVRSKKLPVARAISWSWCTITGKSRSNLSFSPYSSNADRQQSRWGGMDFDSHDGRTDRAQQLAFAAFRCLLNLPDLCVILETSGSGGWHLWAISPDFHDLGEWVRLLKRIASAIGTTIADGVCEIFPPDSMPAKFGKSMRAPGCWNPGSGCVSEIFWENTHTSLRTVLSGKSKTAPLNCNGLNVDFLDNERSISFSASKLLQRWLDQFSINQPATRNLKLSSLVGEVFHQAGVKVARWLAEAQFRTKTATTNATEKDHLQSFNALWAGLEQSWRASLSEQELEHFGQLETDNERDAFRIIRSYARKAASDGASDFPVARDNLAERLGITGKGAGFIREKFTRLGIIEKVCDYQPNKAAARYCWLANLEQPF